MRKTLNISEIKPNDNNPRFITDAKFKKLVKSIKEFPQMLEMRPLVVDEDNVVLGGNMRLEALKAAGVFEVTVHQAMGLTDEQKKEFIIKDNLPYGEWDWDSLSSGWDETLLNDWGFNVWKPSDEDYFDVDEEQEDKKPSLQDDDHSAFELVLEYENKKKLLKVLNDVKKQYDFERQEQALMLIINKYLEHAGK